MLVPFPSNNTPFNPDLILELQKFQFHSDTRPGTPYPMPLSGFPLYQNISNSHGHTNMDDTANMLNAAGTSYYDTPPPGIRRIEYPLHLIPFTSATSLDTKCQNINYIPPSTSPRFIRRSFSLSPNLKFTNETKEEVTNKITPLVPLNSPIQN
jgi:hypothetical protein